MSDLYFAFLKGLRFIFFALIFIIFLAWIIPADESNLLGEIVRSFMFDSESRKCLKYPSKKYIGENTISLVCTGIDDKNTKIVKTLLFEPALAKDITSEKMSCHQSYQLSISDDRVYLPGMTDFESGGIDYVIAEVTNHQIMWKHIRDFKTYTDSNNETIPSYREDVRIKIDRLNGDWSMVSEYKSDDTRFPAAIVNRYQTIIGFCTPAKKF